MSHKREPWKPPKRTVVIYGSLEENPPPVDLRPKIRKLLKRLDAVLAALEIVPAEGSATARDSELNTATWWAWRNASDQMFLLSEVLKEEFLYQFETIYDNTMLSAASNQAINWLGTYTPKIMDWMKAQQVREKRRLPPFPQQFHHGLELAHQRLSANCKEEKSGGPLLPSGAEEVFADFSSKQRMLLTALRDKPCLAFPAVMQAVYGTKDRALSTLERLVSRTNRRLVQKGHQLEIKRKSNTLSLQPLRAIAVPHAIATNDGPTNDPRKY